MGTRKSRKQIVRVDDEMLLVECECFVNPDFGQYSPPAPDLRLAVRDLTCAVRALLAWIRLFNLGGGNMMSANVVDLTKGAVVARISYNGRVWPPGKYEPGAPCLREPTHEDFEEARKAAYATACAVGG